MRIDPRNLSFHWHGRNKQGVSKWTGSLKPLYWLGKIFGVYGALAGVVGAAGWIYWLVSRDATGPLTPVMGVGLIHGIVFTGIGFWARAMHRHIARLSVADEVCARLGVGAAEMQRIAEERKIKPKIILNEIPYYDPADFTDAMVLLRASDRRESRQDVLLRPASATAESAPEALLRASAESSAADPPALRQNDSSASRTAGSGARTAVEAERDETPATLQNRRA